MELLFATTILPPAETHVLREWDPEIRVEAAISGQVVWALTKMPPDAAPRRLVSLNAAYQTNKLSPDVGVDSRE